MSVAKILIMAAGLLTDPARYTRKFAAGTEAGQTFAVDRCATHFSATGAIEHAAALASSVGSKKPNLTTGKIADIAEAKRLVCAHVRSVHLDYWEDRAKPTAPDVCAAFIAASRGAGK